MLVEARDNAVVTAAHLASSAAEVICESPIPHLAAGTTSTLIVYEGWVVNNALSVQRVPQGDKNFLPRLALSCRVGSYSVCRDILQSVSTNFSS